MEWTKRISKSAKFLLLILLGGGGFVFLLNSDYVDIPRIGGMKRHHQALMEGMPEPYTNLVNPLQNDSQAVTSGETIYQTLCSRCHGRSGIGDGPQATKLKFPPANLAHSVSMPVASDAYLFWAITEGGLKFGTDMPSFDKVLSPEKRWQVISYLRTLN